MCSSFPLRVYRLLMQHTVAINVERANLRYELSPLGGHGNVSHVAHQHSCDERCDASASWGVATTEVYAWMALSTGQLLDSMLVGSKQVMGWERIDICIIRQSVR